MKFYYLIIIYINFIQLIYTEKAKVNTEFNKLSLFDNIDKSTPKSKVCKILLLVQNKGLSETISNSHHSNSPSIFNPPSNVEKTMSSTVVTQKVHNSSQDLPSLPNLSTISADNLADDLPNPNMFPPRFNQLSTHISGSNGLHTTENKILDDLNILPMSTSTISTSINDDNKPNKGLQTISLDV